MCSDSADILLCLPRFLCPSGSTVCSGFPALFLSQWVYVKSCLVTVLLESCLHPPPALSVRILLCPWFLSNCLFLLLLCCGAGDGCTPLLLAGRVTSSLRSELNVDFPIGQREGGHSSCAVLLSGAKPLALAAQSQDRSCLTISCPAPCKL